MNKFFVRIGMFPDYLGKGVNAVILETTNVVNLTWLKVIDDIRKRTTRVFKICRCTIMSSVDGDGPTHQGVITEFCVNTAIRVVPLARPIGIEQTNYNRFCVVHDCRIAYLHFVYPLRHRIVVHLLDFSCVHDLLFHNVIVITIHFRGRKMDELESTLLLKPDEMLRADSI